MNQITKEEKRQLIDQWEAAPALLEAAEAALDILMAKPYMSLTANRRAAAAYLLEAAIKRAKGESRV